MGHQSCGAGTRGGSIIGGTIMIVIGGFFLMVNMGWLPFLRESWPVLLIIVGAVLLVGGMRKSRPRQEEPAP